MPTTFRPLFGCHSNTYEPLSFYLEIDEAHILLDCGCFERGQSEDANVDYEAFEASYIETLKQSVFNPA